MRIVFYTVTPGASAIFLAFSGLTLCLPEELELELELLEELLVPLLEPVLSPVPVPFPSRPVELFPIPVLPWSSGVKPERSLNTLLLC